MSPLINRHANSRGLRKDPALNQPASSQLIPGQLSVIREHVESMPGRIERERPHRPIS